jgi:hypothetical protein
MIASPAAMVVETVWLCSLWDMFVSYELKKLVA